jgi:hypothetical protein
LKCLIGGLDLVQNENGKVNVADEEEKSLDFYPV